MLLSRCLSVAGNYLRNQTPVTHHPGALKTACLVEVNLCEGAGPCVCVSTAPKTPPALHSHIKSTRSPITPDQGYLKARMSIGSFQFCCRVCSGGGRSVPRDERISRNQEAVGLAKGYFLVKRFLNCRGDQRRWLSAPKAVYSDKHPAKRGV